ncbi:helix-turn-helix transcriptional regulator [Sphingobacterium sp. CZ-2]|uniref:helix-turn-helix transcriptional regulator n=1 Tax=Sphingobacterium sp. CZ-2 TaxID=2557994 RepID=UPI0010700CF1|nr:LuxR C-terminal-related transcriptional regulator [Sphingobacterium sp. CZ-2]QBR12229.1 response regulator transcription factor [Sphingobacterium sp. CZ-2]
MMLTKKSFRIGLYICDQLEEQRVKDILLGYELVNLLVFNLREESINNLDKTILSNSLDLCILDVKLGINTIEKLQYTLLKVSESKLVLYTDPENVDLLPKFMELCSKGFILQGVHETELLFAISAILNEGIFISPLLADRFFQIYLHKRQILRNFSPKELLVVNGLIEGFSYKQIAEQNQISINAVRDYVKKIYRKLNIQSKGQLLYKLHMP